MADAIHRTTKNIVKSVDSSMVGPEYLVFAKTRDNSDYKDLVTKEIPTKYWVIENEAVREMTTEEKAVIDAIDFEAIRNKMMEQINTEIEQRIHKGKGFPWDDKFFSLSANAQVKWIGLVVGKDVQTYPLRVATKDDLEYYDIPDSDTVVQMYISGAKTVLEHIGTGTVVKEQLLKAATLEEAQTIFDTYMNS